MSASQTWTKCLAVSGNCRHGRSSSTSSRSSLSGEAARPRSTRVWRLWPAGWLWCLPCRSCAFQRTRHAARQNCRTVMRRGWCTWHRPGKPMRITPYRGFPRPGVVVGDQVVTDGILAWRLGYAFVQYHQRPDTAPAGPRLMGGLGRLVRPLVFSRRRSESDVEYSRSGPAWPAPSPAGTGWSSRRSSSGTGLPQDQLMTLPRRSLQAPGLRVISETRHAIAQPDVRRA